MPTAPEDRRRAAAQRDAGIARLRRTSALAAALMVGVGAAFTAFAAGSTHTRKVVAVRRRAARAPRVVLRAPEPPLVQARSATPAPAPAPTPSPAPAPTVQQPVVVSGGS